MSQPTTTPSGAALAEQTRVLVVDDDKLVRRFMSDSLRSLQYHVTEAENGAQGLATLERERFDLLLVDFAMPGMNGAEVARAAQERQPGIKVLMVSGYADSAAVEAALGNCAPASQTFRSRRARRRSGRDAGRCKMSHALHDSRIGRAASFSSRLRRLTPRLSGCTVSAPTGHDFVPIVEELRLPPSMAVRFIFPHARPRPVTINNGFVMRAWYDITGLGPDRKEDDAGIRESAGVVNGYIEQQNARGIDSERIVIAGFSQGGAIALQAGLRYPKRLAGVMALSTYLPLRDSVAAEAVARESRCADPDVPRPARRHGARDARQGIARPAGEPGLSSGVAEPIRWSTQVCMEEVLDISKWLQARLARNL